MSPTSFSNSQGAGMGTCPEEGGSTATGNFYGKFTSTNAGFPPKH